MKLPELNSIFFPLPPLINLILIKCKHDSFENILLNFRLRKQSTKKRENLRHKTCFNPFSFRILYHRLSPINSHLFFFFVYFLLLHFHCDIIFNYCKTNNIINGVFFSCALSFLIVLIKFSIK